MYLFCSANQLPWIWWWINHLLHRGALTSLKFNWIWKRQAVRPVFLNRCAAMHKCAVKFFTVCRQIVKCQRKHVKQAIFSSFWSLFTLRCVFSKLVCRKLKKVDNYCVGGKHFNVHKLWFLISKILRMQIYKTKNEIWQKGIKWRN